MRSNAYMNVGLYVCNYDEYFPHFAEHLAFVKLKHPDVDIRRISAALLSLMSALKPEFMSKEILKGNIYLIIIFVIIFFFF